MSPTREHDTLWQLRDELTPLLRGVLSHRFAHEAEAGELPIEKFRTWTRQQYPILNYDTRSIALMMSRAAHQDEKRLFTMLLEGAKEAEARLERTAEGLGVSFADLTSATLFPRTQAYGHYLAWLGCYGTPGQQAAAMTVNLPTYARVMAKLKVALETCYGVAETDYLELWSLGLEHTDDPLQPAPTDWERQALAIVDRYIGSDRAGIVQATRFLESYELMFWDSVYAGE
jgi:thiaminase